MEKVKVFINFMAVIIIPIVIGFIGNGYSKAIKEREIQGRFVELAINILSQAPTKDNHGIREWATEIIDKYSGVPLGKSTKQDLIENLPITRELKFEGTGYKTSMGERKIDEIVLLDTQSGSIDEEIKGLQQFGVSYHYLVSPSGEIKLLVEEDDIAFHTKGRNSNSIGIGLIHVSGKSYPEAQLKALVALLSDIISRRNIDINRIISNSQVNPKKKSDIPGILNDLKNNVQEKILSLNEIS